MPSCLSVTFSPVSVENVFFWLIIYCEWEIPSFLNVTYTIIHWSSVNFHEIAVLSFQILQEQNQHFKSDNYSGFGPKIKHKLRLTTHKLTHSQIASNFEYLNGRVNDTRLSLSQVITMGAFGSKWNTNLYWRGLGWWVITFYWIIYLYMLNQEEMALG